MIFPKYGALTAKSSNPSLWMSPRFSTAEPNWLPEVNSGGLISTSTFDSHFSLLLREKLKILTFPTSYLLHCFCHITFDTFDLSFFTCHIAKLSNLNFKRNISSLNYIKELSNKSVPVSMAAPEPSFPAQRFWHMKNRRVHGFTKLAIAQVQTTNANNKCCKAVFFIVH